jgi:hypothetical protein
MNTKNAMNTQKHTAYSRIEAIKMRRRWQALGLHVTTKRQAGKAVWYMTAR